MLINVDAKVCSRCKILKPYLEFSTAKHRKDGLNGECKTCYHKRYLERVKTTYRCEKHGLHNTPTYQCWADMKTRCLNENNSNYDFYGGRGIKVCERWLSFSNFYEDMGLRPEGLTLERLDNDGNYEPSNCVWADRYQQNKNKRYSKHSKVGLGLC